MPKHTRVSAIDASPHEPATAYVAGKRYEMADRRPYLWKTNDYGATWTRIQNGIAAGHFTHVVREDPVRRGLLFCGTEHGVYISFDDGTAWQPLQLNLPDVHVPDLEIREDDVVIATHGALVLGTGQHLTIASVDPGNCKLRRPRVRPRRRGSQRRSRAHRLLSGGANPPSNRRYCR